VKTKKLLKKMFKLLKKVKKNTEPAKHSEGTELRTTLQQAMMGAAAPHIALKNLTDPKHEGKTVTFRRPMPFCLRDSDKPIGGIDMDSTPAAPIGGLSPIGEDAVQSVGDSDVRPE